MIRTISWTIFLSVGLTSAVWAYWAKTQLPSQIAAASVGPPSYEMPHVKRPNRLVADIERSLTVYRDILGLTASEPQVSGEDSFSYPVFNIPKGTPMRSVTLHEPAEQRVFALTELKGFDLPRPVSAPFLATAVIGITDLEAKFRKLEEMGLTVTPSKVAGGADFKFIEQAFVDFDGHLIVCYEVLPEGAAG